MLVENGIIIESNDHSMIGMSTPLSLSLSLSLIMCVHVNQLQESISEIMSQKGHRARNKSKDYNNQKMNILIIIGSILS